MKAIKIMALFRETEGIGYIYMCVCVYTHTHTHTHTHTKREIYYNGLAHKITEFKKAS